jgi:hypothetical protein
VLFSASLSKERAMGLVDEIRLKIESGELPGTRPPKLWGGFGHFEDCSACAGPIFPAQIRYEFGIDEDVVRLHIGCFGLWDAERRRRGCDPEER